MKVVLVKNYKEMSEKAAEIVANQIRKNPDSVLGFATGKTPLGLYGLLVKSYKKGVVDFSKIRSFSLDEYYPISKKNKKSFFYYLHKHLFDKINIKKENINLLNGEAKNWRKECLNYEKKIKKNKIDLQVLGVGENGHIGFNEPGSKKNSRTRLVKLAKETKKSNKTNKNALTMGISVILKAQKILLLASGKTKAQAIRRLVKGKEDRGWPVSFLKKHKNLIVIADKKAASLLNN